MIEADSVHSMPQVDSSSIQGPAEGRLPGPAVAGFQKEAIMSVVEFPGKEPPPDGYSENHFDKLHAAAFRDLEDKIQDINRMGEIAEGLVADWVDDVNNERCLELASFAVQHLADMLRELKAIYYAVWDGRA
jgi:hypothetical protein